MIGGDASDLARQLAARIGSLVAELLPGGHREGHEWRCGSVAGEVGQSLAVHLHNNKAGIWADFATGEAGDALDLVRSVLGCDMPGALAWSRRWLGIDAGNAEMRTRRVAPSKAVQPKPEPDRWRKPWGAAQPIAGTLAESYLGARGLRFADPEGAALLFHPRQARLGPVNTDTISGDTISGGGLEFHPAMLVLLSDVWDGEPCGIINIFLKPDGLDRLRDRKGKTCSGRAKDAAVMLVDFAEVTMGLTICEGTETGITLLQAGQGPVWACGGAGNLSKFPVLAGIEALTVAADADQPGRQAAETVAARWRAAGREVAIIAPPAGDWGDR